MKPPSHIGYFSERGLDPRLVFEGIVSYHEISSLRFYGGVTQAKSFLTRRSIIKVFLRTVSALLPIALLLGAPAPSLAMIGSVTVVNVSSHCAWITPYKMEHIFGGPRFLKPGEHHKFSLENGVTHKGGEGAGAAGSGVPVVRFASLAIRAEITGAGTNCNHGVTKDIRTPNVTDSNAFTYRDLTAELRGSPAHYHIEVMGR